MSSAIDSKEFRYEGKGALKLKEWPTRVKSFYRSKEEYKEMLADHVSDMSQLQEMLYADGHQALLIMFQAMDAAGKDGAIEHVMSGVNPQGCQVYSFKQPSHEELAHDFLWRTTKCLPERGRIGIFNRSYYEEVLVVRVHPELLLAGKISPKKLDGGQIWTERYEEMKNFEQHLHRNGTRVIKFFLHVSKEEQRRRLLSRVEDPSKNWKVSLGDVREREKWKEYQHAYEAAIGGTSTGAAPWYIVPADDKKNARLIISNVIRGVLRSMKLNYPELSEKQRKDVGVVRRLLKKK